MRRCRPKWPGPSRRPRTLCRSREQVEPAQRSGQDRSNVPDARSRCMVIAVITNITNNGKRPSRTRQAVLNPDGAPGRCRDVVEHEVHQRDDEDRHHQNHRDAAAVSGELTQDPRCGGAVGLKSYPARRSVLRLMIDRNASSSELHPVSSRSWWGVVWATRCPSRISNRSPQ